MHKIKVRGVIINNNNKVFLVREIKKHFYYLPGGKLEQGESFKECLNREIIEELGVKPIIGDIISIREFENNGKYQLDIWFNIKNYKDYINIDKSKASHSHEYYDEGFYSFSELEGKDLRPKNLKELLNKKINIL